ncbi:YjaG family protein [Neptuniibacter sp.]|uniref:YjaG family protein n=1 Tax=Neptuniibacter sp. TaxID=1962643 RepID=UPI0026248EA0|nr:YjaG family protein [Neptuniibacter sp.]MCP4595941.1 YjaG family protein [Neptuniibacter sp.]
MSDQRFDKEFYDLNDWQLAAFCAAISERMFPNFALFANLMEFGDADKMRQILNGVWDNLGNTGAKMNFEVQLDKVEANMPDLEEFDMYGASPALDAVVALFSTLNTVIAADASEVITVGNMSRECVATFIELSADDQMSDDELVRYINTHELMQQEDDFQADILEIIQDDLSRSEALKELRELAHNDGYSNIGISDSES